MTRRKGIMLAYPLEEKRLHKWGPPYICQPKLDGERCRALPGLLLSSEENPFFFLDHIHEELDMIREDLPGLEFDGELSSRELSFEEIHSRISRTKNKHPEIEQVQYHIFDYKSKEAQVVRTMKLAKYAKEVQGDYVHFVPSLIAESFEEVMNLYNRWVSQGYEGIIVRHPTYPYVERRSTGMVKFKPKKRDEYKVIGYKEEVSIDGVPKGRLGALVCESDGEEFSVGSGFTDEQRLALWEEKDLLYGSTVVVEYQHTTKERKVPRFPIYFSIKL